MEINSINNATGNVVIFGKLKNYPKTATMQNDSIELESTKSKKSTFKDKLKLFGEKVKIGLAALAGAVISGLTVFAVMNTKVQKEKVKTEQLKQALDNVVLPEDFNDKVESKITELSSKELEYDPMKRVNISQTEEIYRQDDNEDAITMPLEREHTNNRADAKVLNYPKFDAKKPYHFEFPTSSEIKITKNEKNFTPQPLTKTTISESYADSLQWNDDKIARDLMQNFFDGHGQTLDGVAIDVNPTKDGKHKVRISGKSIYSADKAILLGESSKKDDLKAAGCYGEGLKMVVLKLLREKGADNVSITSGDWNVNWSFADSGINDKKVLAYELKETEHVDGNYIEFETDNNDFIEAILNSYDKFYHYNNPAFKCPDFENDKLGIKILNDDKAPAKLFIAGQEFEIDGKYNGLQGAHIFIKERPPIKDNGEYIFDPSRDRTSLTSDNIESIGKWLASEKEISKEDCTKALHSLIDYWESYPMFKMDHNGPVRSFTNGLIKGAYYRGDKLRIDFPDEKYVADSIRVSHELKDEYYNAGYKICHPFLEYLGMKSIETLVDKSRQHTPLQPTEAEKNKILILKDALKILAPLLKVKDQPLFTEEELSPTILIFDKDSPEESEVYKDTMAEAIIESRQSLGFWIDKTYLKSNFADVLGTTLHELTHKYGGDDSSIFSYKLTDVLQKVLENITNNPNIAMQLRVLEEAWNAQT
ncbi:hypothetical protein IJ182_04800 [bacterium]|nr:hypothetical protein [bacterium]